jgi:hypothetical protein
MKYFADKSFTRGKPKSPNVRHSTNNSEFDFLKVTPPRVVRAEKRKLFETIADLVGNIKWPL